MAPHTPLFKVSLIGPPASGKTALARRFVSNEFDATYTPGRLGKSMKLRHVCARPLSFTHGFSSAWLADVVDLGVKVIDVGDPLGMVTVEVCACCCFHVVCSG